MIWLLTALFATPAQAADDPGVWFRQQIGFGGWPAGLMADSRVQYRTPLARKEGSLMLNDTYAGAGALVRVTPAFSEVGPRLSIAPVDMFDLDLQFSRLQYYSNGFGLMGFDRASGKLDSQRSDRADQGDGVVSGGWSATATPTVKVAVGPIVSFYSASISWIKLDDQGTAEPYTYEPWRDQVIAWEDVTIEHEAAFLLKPIDKDDGTKLWFGGWARDRFSLEAPDRSTTVGPAIIARASGNKWVPTILGRSMFYVTDGDRVGRVPNLQCATIWVFE